MKDAITVKAEVVDDGLSEIERSELLSAETQINKGLQSFFEIGSALRQIQENKLYRADYSSFEEYLEIRWGMSREQGYRDIAAAKVAQNLLPIGNTPPTAESQIRLLAPLDKEEQCQVWEAAIKRTPNGTPTAATVAMVLSERGLPVPKSALPKGTFTEANRNSDELYTPFELLQSAYYCLGDIDLDPCSNSLEEPNVKAKSHYTKELDGLDPNRIWAGTLFINPPYSAPNPWISRLNIEYLHHEVDAAIILLPVDPSTGWWSALAQYPVCLINQRLKFIGATGSARFASAAFYLGPDLAKFYECFRGWGEIRQTLEPGLFAE